MLFEGKVYEEVGELGKSKNQRTVLLHHEQGEFLVYKEISRETAPIFQMLKEHPHPNIVSVYKVKAVDEETCGVFMEYIMADTLEDRMVQKGKIPLKEAKNIMLQLCYAVWHYQRMGIVHRDLKPLNILVSPEGAVKITDFGIARTYKKDQICDTQFLGTAGYAAPEQFGFSQTSHKADIYALGVIFNRMLTGKMPVEEVYNGNEKIAVVIRKCIRMSPEERCSLEELEEVLGGRRLIKRPWGKRILRCIPGFRTGNKIHMALAIVEYGYMSTIYFMVIVYCRSLFGFFLWLLGYLVSTLGIGWVVGSFGKVSFLLHVDKGFGRIFLGFVYGCLGIFIWFIGILCIGAGIAL